ncbi:MAG: hypothetical protein KKI09_09455 [Spirochaetes bacterium]|nr:hypothetical protein [Spirochaetota bacterium]MBU0955640.1 hypothetical protein [Spirochaetota bacterium]
MKMKQTLAIVLIFLFALGSSWAIPVTVDFVDGSVQVQSGSSWKLLDFGDKFDSAQQLKVDARTVLELSVQGGAVVVISTAGTYVVDSLLRPRQESTVISTIASKIERLANQQTNINESVVAGVRGSEAVEPGELMWAGVGADAELVYDDGLGNMESGEFTLAWNNFMEARLLFEEAGDIEGQARAAWQASQAGLALGSGARALAALRSADAEDAGEFRSVYALALATLSARYGAVNEAKVILTKALAEKWFSGESEQDAKALLNSL